MLIFSTTGSQEMATQLKIYSNSPTPWLSSFLVHRTKKTTLCYLQIAFLLTLQFIPFRMSFLPLKKTESSYSALLWLPYPYTLLPKVPPSLLHHNLFYDYSPFLNNLFAFLNETAWWTFSKPRFIKKNFLIKH